MKRYLEHMHRKPAHDRRQHALRVAGVLTGLVFVGWVTTLGVQLGGEANTVSDNSSAAQTAAAITSGYQDGLSGGGNQLIVATSSSY